MRAIHLVLCASAFAATAASQPAYSQSASGSIFSWSGGAIHRATKSQQGRPYAAPRGVSYTPLSKQECEGLGGKVHFSLSCKSTGYVCATVDPHGVVRMQCLTK